MTRTTRAVAATGALALGLAAPAAAHITANPGEAPADGFANLAFSVGHGCEDSPTTRVRIRIPSSVPSVTPQRTPFWDISTKEGKKDPVELHGEEITRGVSEVTYTAKEPLDPHELDLLGMSVKLPAGEAGESVYFPAIQECAEGANRWIQIPGEGESGEELESPAPAVVLTNGGGGHGASSGDAPAASDEQQASADAQPAAATVAADEDDGAPVWLAVVALVLGALGLLSGIAGLLSGRRASA